MTVDELNDRTEKQKRLLELIDKWKKEDEIEERESFMKRKKIVYCPICSNTDVQDEINPKCWHCNRCRTTWIKTKTEILFRMFKGKKIIWEDCNENEVTD